MLDTLRRLLVRTAMLVEDIVALVLLLGLRLRGRHHATIVPFIGHGTPRRIRVHARIVLGRKETEAPATGVPGAAPPTRKTRRAILRASLARFVTVEVPRARVRVTVAGVTTEAVSNRDGYLDVVLDTDELAPGWHDVGMRLDNGTTVTAKVVVIDPAATIGLISDIDDTVMHTGVANKLVMLWRLFVEDAESRVAFPGVATLYRALHAGGTGAEGNPMLYVSRAPWGLYEVLSAFFHRHAIPVGPILFLREWGLSWTHPLPRRAEDHKRVLIAHMLELYRHLPVVLIGDSGQHDPEVYARVVAEHPGRVRAIYIRNVSADAARIAEIERIAEAVTRAGASFVLAADSVAMAEHAAGLGLIAPEAVAAVAGERAAAPEPAIGPLQGVLRPAEPPPTLVVEPEAGKRIGP